MYKKLIALGFTLGFIILACSLIYIWNAKRITPLKPSELESYCVNMAYSSNNHCSTIKNNETAQEVLHNWTNLIKDMGFKGVGLAELECYYWDDYLTTYLDYLNESGLKVAVYIMWRDFTINFTFGEPNAIPSDVWKPQDFPDNSTKCEAWISFVDNITEITKNYDNIQFYLLFMPFRWWDWEGKWYEANFSNQSGYKYWMQEVVNTIKANDDKPVILVSDGIEIENSSLIPYLPYGLKNIDGYGFTYYSRTPDDFCESKFNEMVSLYQKNLKDYLDGKGFLWLAEWGYQITNEYGYGRCSSESRKAQLIHETLEAIMKYQIKYFGYFAIQDFPSEKADFGLAYYDFTLKPSGLLMKTILKEE